MADNVLQKLHSLGREGLSHISRMSLAIVSNDHHDEIHHASEETAFQGLQSIFDSLFRENRIGTSRFYANGKFILNGHPPTALETQLSQSPCIVMPGNLLFHQCLLTTPSSILHYTGPELLSNPCLSAARYLLESGDLEGGRERLKKGIAKGVYPKTELWLALISSYTSEEFDTALEMCELALRSCPGAFGPKSELRRHWLAAYRAKGDLGGAIMRFKSVIDQRESSCWLMLSMAYRHNGEYDNAVKTLEMATENCPEIAEECWAARAEIYDIDLDDPIRAIEAWKMALLLCLGDRSSYLIDLVQVYKRSGRYQETVLALESELRLRNRTMISDVRIVLLSHFTDACIEVDAHELAIRILQKERCKHPLDERICRLLGRMYIAKGELKEAATVFRTAIDEGFLDPDVKSEFLALIDEVTALALNEVFQQEPSDGSGINSLRRKLTQLILFVIVFAMLTAILHILLSEN